MGISILKLHYVTVKLLVASMYGYELPEPHPAVTMQVMPAAFESPSLGITSDDPESANLFACIAEGIRIVAYLKQHGWAVRAECSGAGNEPPSQLAGWHQPLRYNYAESMLRVIEREFALRSERYERFW